MTLGLLFPGQGSQVVGMGKALADAHPEAARAFEEADDALGTHLSRIMWEGPLETLTETRHAQPAIFTHSVAVLRVLGPELDGAVIAAGHSLGEFSAHVAAGTLGFAEGLGAVRRRGELMFEAGLTRPGTMAAVLGLGNDEVERICRGVSAPNSVVVMANLNSEGQIVISGDVDAVGRAVEALADAGARRVVPLTVSGAFHSPLMAPAQAPLEEALERVAFHRPRFSVVSNVTAGPVTEGSEARELLVEQLVRPVRWQESVSAMIETGVDRFLEIGPGSVLTGLNRRNARGVPTTPVGDPEHLEKLEL
jgi:[acyl-carrier-protein] S-malonyltransferase